MKTVLVFLLACTLVGCGKGNKKPSTASPKDPIEKPKPKPKPDMSSLEILLNIGAAIGREMPKINFGSASTQVKGKPEWVQYYKPWQLDDETWYARVKVIFPDEVDAQDPPHFLVKCHFHADQTLACHRNEDTDVGDEPIDDDHKPDPGDGGDGGDDDCNPADPGCDAQP